MNIKLNSGYIQKLFILTFLIVLTSINGCEGAKEDKKIPAEEAINPVEMCNINIFLNRSFKNLYILT